jgi:hypothetical protein
MNVIEYYNSWQYIVLRGTSMDGGRTKAKIMAAVDSITKPCAAVMEHFTFHSFF